MFRRPHGNAEWSDRPYSRLCAATRSKPMILGNRAAAGSYFLSIILIYCINGISSACRRWLSEAWPCNAPTSPWVWRIRHLYILQGFLQRSYGSHQRRNSNAAPRQSPLSLSSAGLRTSRTPGQLWTLRLWFALSCFLHLIRLDIDMPQRVYHQHCHLIR